MTSGGSSAEGTADAQNGNPVPEDRIAEYQHVYGGYYRFDTVTAIAPKQVASGDQRGKFVKLYQRSRSGRWWVSF